MQIGCQTITFRNEANPRPLPEQLKAVAQAGFDGVEIASRTLDLFTPGERGALLEEKDNNDAKFMHVLFRTTSEVSRKMRPDIEVYDIPYKPPRE